MYPVEDFSQALTFGRVDAFYESDTALEVCAKIGMGFAVLAFWSVVNTVIQGSLETVKVCADNIEVLVGNETGEVLAHSLPHDAGLAMVDIEALLEENGRYLRCETLDARRKLCASGKRQIVGVPGVLGVRREG